jgi:hypothetical protein
MDCKQKITFHSAAIAEDARQGYVATHKTDKRNARLTVYPCHHCGKFHLGHLRRKPVAVQAAPKVKQPTAGDLRRAAKRAAKEADRKAARAELYKDWAETMRHVAWLIERDFASRA